MGEVVRSKVNIPAFDGLRGVLSVWVLLSHATQFVDGPRGLIDRGGIAVDMFMFVSGFLMLWNVENRASKEPPAHISTWRRFFTRRFFRIAPLYYCALALALLFADEWKASLKHIYLNQGLSFVRPFEVCARDGGLNILSHLSFTFGLHPCYAASTIIPDWSLSLEMQFYLCFPVLFLLLRRVPAILFAIAAAAIVGVSAHLISVYVMDSARILSFPQPSLLVLRLNCFVAGMLLARIVCSDRINLAELVALAISILVFQRATFGVIAAMVCLMVLRAHLPSRWVPQMAVRTLGWIAMIFESRVGRLLGDLSYGVYLLHIFLLIPLVAFLQTTHWFGGLSGLGRFLTVVVVILPLVLSLAKLTFVLIEQPFIELGRRFSK